MAQSSAGALQLIQPGQNAVFTSTFITPREMGIILPTADQSGFYLRGLYIPRGFFGRCVQDFFAEFYASFSANIQIPTGGTAGEASVAITVDGNPVQSGIMITNLAAVENFANVSTQVFVPIPRGASGLISVENTSAQEIGMQNANMTVFVPGFAVR